MQSFKYASRHVIKIVTREPVFHRNVDLAVFTLLAFKK
jgi:hypothetical protein